MFQSKGTALEAGPFDALKENDEKSSDIQGRSCRDDSLHLVFCLL